MSTKAQLMRLLEEVSRSAHQNGQLFTSGKMHPGPWETCKSMQCEDVRDAIGWKIPQDQTEQ